MENFTFRLHYFQISSPPFENPAYATVSHSLIYEKTLRSATFTVNGLHFLHFSFILRYKMIKICEMLAQRRLFTSILLTTLECSRFLIFKLRPVSTIYNDMAFHTQAHFFQTPQYDP